MKWTGIPSEKPGNCSPKMTDRTDEPVVIQLRLATWGSRFWAWLIDIILVGIIASVMWNP